jgi:hypothetical protein
MRHGMAFLAVGLIGLSAASPKSATGQRRNEAKVAAPVQLRVVQLDAPPVVTVKRASIGKHILVGSVIGAVATVGAIWYTVARQPDQECMTCPIVFATVVVGGAVVGGLIGAVVYAARDPAQH